MVARLSSALLLLAAMMAAQTSPQSNDDNVERVLVASKMFSLLTTYGLGSSKVAEPEFTSLYEDYIRSIIATDDRRQFDLAAVKLSARLQNGHTFFWDTSLDKSNRPLGFYAAAIGGYWVIERSSLANLKPGDVVTTIDETPVEAFFQQQERYIAASSTAARRHNLFLLPFLFPEQFTVTVDGNRTVAINRDKSDPAKQTVDGRWLKPEITAYIQIPGFNHPVFEDQALDHLRRFRHAKTLILDLRGNGGGTPPTRLIQALMDRPYREWKQASTLRVPMLDCDEGGKKKLSSLPEPIRDCKYSPDDHLCRLPITWGGNSVSPTPGAFQGRVVLLVDGGCVSACEELVEPMKDSGRAVIVGEPTQGSSGLPYVYDFHNGMTLTIAVKRLFFPDGSEFEGVGIRPDVEVHTSIDDLKKGRDPILEKALELSQKE